MSSQPGDAPPSRQARPTSIEDVIVQRENKRKQRRQPAPGQPVAGRKGKHSIGLQEVSINTSFCAIPIDDLDCMLTLPYVVVD